MVFPEPFLAHSDSQPAAPSLKAPCDAKVLLAAAIDELSQTGKLVLCLHYYEALSLDEVAAVLGLELLEVNRLHAAALTQLYASGRM